MSAKLPDLESKKVKSEKMVRYTQRMLAWSAYQESLRESDRIIVTQVEASIHNLRTGLWVRAGTYLLQISILGGAFFVSSQHALVTTANINFSSLIALVSLVLLGLLLYRNPLQTINRTLIELARVQIILQGYQRQVNQIDAVFKQSLLENEIDQETLAHSLEQIQRIIDANVESLLQFIEEMST